jgi:hypothetical protein
MRKYIHMKNIFGKIKINYIMDSKLDEIKNCKYISSVGMLKLLDELDIITYGDGIIDDAHKVTYNFSKISEGYDGVCIYVKFSYISEFFINVFHRINYKFILITGDGDETIPNDIFNIDTFNNIINSEKIIHWYSTNCIENIHKKLSLIPIGVNFHSLSFGEFCGWHNTSMTPSEQEISIQEIKDKSLIFSEREIKCYSNFHFGVNNDPANVYIRFGNPRKEFIDKVSSNIVYYEYNKISRLETWENQSKYAFVVSPMGNGMDTHRTWEALILGCIVIVKKSPLDTLYDELPVLIVDKWEDIDENLLKDTIDKFKDMKFNYEKIINKQSFD